MHSKKAFVKVLTTLAALFTGLNLRFRNFNKNSLSQFTIALLAALPLLAQAQGQVPQASDQTTTERFVAEIPEKFRQARENQQALAKQENVTLHRYDAGKNSSTTMQGVPRELQSLRVVNEGQLETIIPRLYRYYALVGTESLRPDRKVVRPPYTEYVYREYIDGKETSALVSLLVNGEDNRIESISGTLHIDRDLDRMPRQSEAQAIDIVVRNIDDTAPSLEIYRVEGNHFAEVIYQPWGESAELTPFWRVNIELESTPSDSVTHQSFIVDPDGNVGPAGTAQNSSLVRVCDGSGYSGDPFCSLINNPLVLDQNGTCQPPYLCPATPYELNRNEAIKNQTMWEDITGGTFNVGMPNIDGNYYLDVNVGGNVAAGAAVYRTSGNKTVIVIESAVANDPTFMGHEMGHALHDLLSPTTSRMSKLATPVDRAREHAAVLEYIGEVNSVFARNYDPSSPSKFVSNPNLNTNTGKDISVQFNHTQMSGTAGVGQADYENARVGGHAVYTLATNPAVGALLAAKIFINSIARLDEWNYNNSSYLSFNEVRLAMLDAAAAHGTAAVSAVMDAWYDVGVGNSSIGQVNPPTDPLAGSPQAAWYVNALLTQACDANNRTVHTISTAAVGAQHYVFWYSTDWGLSYHSFAQANGSGPWAGVWNTVPVRIKVSACTIYGCAVLSNDYRDLPDLCP